MAVATESPAFSRDFSRVPAHTVQRQSSSSPSSAQDEGAKDAATDGGTGGGGGGSCQVDVRATKITGLGGLPVYHLFVIYKDSAGLEYYYRGGPGGGAGGGYGNIITNHGRYLPGTVDWAPGAPSVTALSGPAACGKDASFRSELGRIDAAAIPYRPLGPNSNSVARTILNKSGVPEVKPVFIAPGWGQVL